MSYSNAEYLEIYKHMSYARYFSLTFEEYALKGILPGFHHLALGEEGMMVGMWTEKQDDDVFCCAHRCRPMLGWYIGVERYLNEILGRDAGFNGGMAGDSHYFALDRKCGPFSGLLGYAQTMALGAAFNKKKYNEPGCVVLGVGDGAMNEGVVAEALNLTAIWKLPVVWYIDNNGLAISTPSNESHAIRDLSERGKGFGLPGSSYDASDVFLVKEVMHEAMEKARRGEPSIIELRTNRWLGHFVGDPQGYRDPVTVDEARANRDPLVWCRNQLLARKVATEAELDKIDKDWDKYMHDLMDKVLAGSIKSKEKVLNTPVYAD